MNEMTLPELECFAEMLVSAMTDNDESMKRLEEIYEDKIYLAESLTYRDRQQRRELLEKMMDKAIKCINRERVKK